VDALLLGISLGVGAGLAPGPLLALVVRAALERGFRAGARVAVAPLVTDVPIVVASVVLAASLPAAVLGILGIGGGLFVMSLGVGALRGQPTIGEAPVADLRRGALVNLLSPHPWIFWFGVGAPILARASTGGDVAFLAAFYALLVGTKLTVAALLSAGRPGLVRAGVPGATARRTGVLHRIGRRRLVGGRPFILAVRASGVLLLLAGVVLVVEGVERL
jgi:threonine/homoserine/homoserine lactone efflux protein